MFLDEIGDMPLGMQAKLLRVLQERTVRPVGGDSEIPSTCASSPRPTATSRTRSRTKRFRKDLYFRLNVIHVAVPPLRARGGDMLPLAQHFLGELRARVGKPSPGIAPAAAERLLAYDWPGNVRELENCLERAVALARFEQIRVDDLPDKIRDYRRVARPRRGDDPPSCSDGRGRAPLHAARARGLSTATSTDAARILGFERKTLYRKRRGGAMNTTRRATVTGQS